MVSRIETGSVDGQGDRQGDDHQVSITTTEQQRKRFDQNYGAMTMILGYLPRLEQL